ncbi:hypothetical protein VaNZ11_001055 [Volvox africanus]|uniref:Nucleotide-diphospho-sugar transferase domain-containing protein n=1 Tax=Volvox africanus TaxID=51714 RepID=A0ABQ5RP63_9CHLO|nr:hypothetical protein VaNZ11_001055 [Volvox africanus]
MVRWVYVFLNIVAQLLVATANRACERSKYCSHGKIKGYIGPLDTAAQLREALEATHYKGEVIVFGETRLSDAAQALARFREVGYAHVLPVLEEASQCHHIRSVFFPWPSDEGPLSCGTYAIHDASGNEYHTRFKYLARMVGFSSWWRKWFTVGRAVALGYNVMAVDSDVLVLDDWYWRVKQPPLSDFNMLTQNEWGVSFNGGFSYIQNATSSGPVAWLLFEALHRAVRWAEDDSAIMAISPAYASRRQIGLNDQGILQECLHSAVLGHPVYPSVLAFYGDDKEAFSRLGMTGDTMFRAMNDPVYKAWQMGQRYPVSGELAEAVCERYMEADCPTYEKDTVQISTVELKMPHSGGKWPVEFGGYPFNRTPGPLTTAYRQAYADLGVNLWPDPEDPATEAAARGTKPERFGYLSYRTTDTECSGCWAESTWWMTGRHGWWHKQLPGYARRKVGIGHIWANLFPGEYQKEIILMHTGWYNWRVAARLAKSRSRVYIANQLCTFNHIHNPVPDIRTVVAYQPGVIHANLSKEQYVQAVQGLAQVAVALGSIAAWPAAACDSEWALTEEAHKSGRRPTEHAVPWSYLNTYYTVQPFGENLQGLQCEWAGFSHYDCLCTQQPDRLEVGRGMLAVEFQHLVTSTRAVPSLDTTLKLEDGVPAAAPPPAGNIARQAVRYRDLIALNAKFVFRRLQTEQMPIFWLDRLVEVSDLDGEAADQFNHWRTKCLALHYLDLTEEQRGRV